MSAVPETKFVAYRDGHLAYQTVGDGPIDVMLINHHFTHIEVQWEDPQFTAFLRGIASFARLIVYDAPGCGLSDAEPEDQPSIHESVLAVLDAVGSPTAALIGVGAALSRASQTAIAEPTRVAALVACEGVATWVRADDYPAGLTEEQLDRFTARNLEATSVLPEGSAPEELRQWFARYVRLATRRGLRERIRDYTRTLDIRALLPEIGVPTLVVQHPETTNPAHGRYLAEHIPDARLVELPGRALWSWRFDDPSAVVDVIEEFLTGTNTARARGRTLATILFANIVGSTSQAAEVGDRRWHAVLDALDELVSGAVAKYGGRIVKSTGDGHLATFDSPTNAIDCAIAIRSAATRVDLQLRIGLHTGEVEGRGDDIGGLAVHIARRVCDEADAAQILVSASLPLVVTGSRREFQSAGNRELKGVPGSWELFAVTTES